MKVGPGETLRVTLDSSTDAGANELYVRYEGLPNSIHFDAAYPGALTADQIATVPTTKAGYYYILARAQGASSNIRLTASLLPFAIASVTPDNGGADRYVTVTLNGAKFDPQATVKLIRPTFAEYTPVTYKVVDATRIIATFDLRNAPHGLYDIQVANPGGQVARVPYRYQIESPLPLDLSVGLGGPSSISFSLTGGAPPAIYGVSVQSLTNVDMPYLQIEYGVPRLKNTLKSKLAGYLREDEIADFNLLVGDEAISFSTDFGNHLSPRGLSLDDLKVVLNRDGRLTATGIGQDLVDRGFGGLSFGLEVFPGFSEFLRLHPTFIQRLLDDPSFDPDSLKLQFYIYAAATPMTAVEYLDNQKTEAAGLRAKILAEPISTDPARVGENRALQALKAAAANSDDWAQLYLTALADAGMLRSQDVPPEVLDHPKFTSQLHALATAVLGEPGGASYADGNLAKDVFFPLLRRWLGETPETFGSSTLPTLADVDLQLSHRTHFEAFKITAGLDASLLQGDVIAVPDANLKDLYGLAGLRDPQIQVAGPSGFGPQLLLPVGLALPYLTTFKNPLGASSAVGDLQIVQKLDRASDVNANLADFNVDVRSFRLSDVQLGDILLDLPNDRGSFTGEFDFSNDRGFVLQVTAGVDIRSGIATWHFRAIDKETGLLVNDPALGFLKAGEQARVGYTIEALDKGGTGATITVSARAISGTKTPLDSAILTGTVDAIAPVTQLTVESVGGGVYNLSWIAHDDAFGAGVKDSTVYVSIDGGAYTTFRDQLTETTIKFVSPNALPAKFIVLSSDHAGNAEAGPIDVLLPEYDRHLNLGALPRAPQARPTAPVVLPATSSEAQNGLFRDLLKRFPSLQTPGRSSGFQDVFEPFVGSGFATGFASSGSGIGPLGIALSADGNSVYISGGPGRNQLWRFNRAGGAATAPIATLPVPIYDLAFDRTGRLWATTGGGPLVELDPATGSIIRQLGDGVQLGLALDPVSGRLFVSTSRGVESFDPATLTFRSFSKTRVDGLAVAPSGDVWAAARSPEGQIVRFDSKGRAAVQFQFDQAVDGLAFGTKGTSTEGLLFVSHSTGGDLTVIDLGSGQTLSAASGGTRGDFVRVDSEGRAFISLSDRVALLSPVLAPRVVATLPIEGSSLLPVVSFLAIDFDSEMRVAGNEAGSVINPANYDLRRGGGTAIAITRAEFEGHRVRLFTGSLASGKYQLLIHRSIQSAAGIPLTIDTTLHFEVLDDLTAVLPPVLSTTRTDQGAGTVSFEIELTNRLPYRLQAPVRLILTRINVGDTGGLQFLSPDGLTEDGHPYLELWTDATLPFEPGQTIRRTVTLANPAGLALDLGIRVVASVPENVLPVFDAAPGGIATVGTAYAARLAAHDPDGPSVTYVLVHGPASSVLDSKTGALTWNPAVGDGRTVTFEVRAYDAHPSPKESLPRIEISSADWASCRFPSLRRCRGHLGAVDFIPDHRL